MHLSFSSYNEEFVGQAILFGRNVRTLTNQREALRVQYSELLMNKTDMVMRGEDVKAISAEMDTVLLAWKSAREKVDSALSEQLAYLRTCPTG